MPSPLPMRRAVPRQTVTVEASREGKMERMTMVASSEEDGNGYVSGVLSKLFDKELVTKKVKCMGIGDEYCEFLTAVVLVGDP